MALTAEQKRKADDWLKQKVTNWRCPSCGASNWAVVWDMIAPPFEIGGAVRIPGPRLPQLPVICTNCAYIRLYAARPMGLVDE